MYSVVRMINDVASEDANAGLVSLLNKHEPGLAKLRRNGVVCVLSESGDWEDHAARVLWFVERCRDALAFAKKHHHAVTLDVAIEPEDVGESSFSVFCSTDLINRIAEMEMALEVSIY